MYKRIVFSAAAACCLLVVLFGTCYAMRLLTKEEGLKDVFGEVVEIFTENKEMVEPVLSKAKERLGGNLVYSQKGASAGKVEAKTNIDFYFALKDGKKDAVAIIDVEPGKWGPVEFMIALDLQGAVTRVEVLNYQEKKLNLNFLASEIKKIVKREDKRKMKKVSQAKKGIKQATAKKRGRRR